MFIELLLLIPIVVSSSSYAPHSPLSLYSKQWFEGWYTRMVLDNGAQLGIIIGSFQLGADKLNFSSTLVSVLYKSHDSDKLASLDYFPAVEIKDVDGPRFEIAAHNDQIMATFKVSNYSVEYDIVFGSNSIHAKVFNFTPWAHNGEGPEGFVENFGPLLPLHWYVHSVKSHVEVTYTIDDGSETTINGLAHMEKNWGGAFPNHWIWIQAVSNEAQIVLAGGDLGIKLSPQLFLCTIKGKNVDLRWSPIDALLRPLKLSINSNKNKVGAFGFHGDYFIILSIEANEKSFSEVQCPTKEGFRRDSVETYSATMQVEIRHRKTAKLVERIVFEGNAALEFGGEWRKKVKQDKIINPLFLVQ